MKLQELKYPGNIGMIEMYKFYQVATPSEKAKMKELIRDDPKAAWEFLQSVTKSELDNGGIKLAN